MCPQTVENTTKCVLKFDRQMLSIAFFDTDGFGMMLAYTRTDGAEHRQVHFLNFKMEQV